MTPAIFLEEEPLTIFMGGKTTFSENQQTVLPINMHISSIFLVIHSL